MGKRISYLDELKGFGIILVVLGHLAKGLQSYPVRLIYGFPVPLFFIISGILIEYKKNI